MGSSENKSELLNQLKIDKDLGNHNDVSLKALLITAVLSALISGVLVYMIFGQTPQSPSPTPTTSSIQTSTSVGDAITDTTSEPGTGAEKTKRSESEQILNASGYITARRVATVSAEIMGLIESVKVEEGMKVQQDQVLATLDSALAKVNLELAQSRVKVLQASMNSTKAELREAERELTRIKRLQTSNFSSEAELTRAQSKLDQLSATFVRAQEDIQVAKLEVSRQQEMLDNHTIRAPFAGVVTVKNAQPGEIVAPSSAGGGHTRTGICTIVDMNSLEIEVDVNEAFIGRVFSGQQVLANLDAYSEWDIPASVIAIIPTADRAKATVRVRIRIEVKDPRILPDMGVKVAFLKS